LYYNADGTIQRVQMTGSIVPNGRYKLLAKHSGKALDVAGCSTADGANVIVWPYWGGDCQRWWIETTP
ncbi:MAG: RICIN domain-containing protein, partial [Gemmatimonadota bacterium]|nr:RICIN domain-containing protein [Gemmatimonadota bacterium]